MAQRNLLQIINAAQGELGLPVASTVINNSDATTSQMLRFAQLEIEELNQRHNWTKLQLEYDLAVNVPTTITGNTTANSYVLTGLSSTAGLSAQNFQLSGTGIPTSARIQSVDSASQITMTMEATASGTGITITCMQDTYSLPSDFGRYVNRTWWDRTNRWELLGPDSPQLDQWHRSGIVTTGPRRHFRNVGYNSNGYRLWPPPAEITAPLQLVFEYITNNNVQLTGTGTSYSSQWTNDTDIPILDDRAIVMGIIWRFWAQKGLNWALKRTEYDNYVDRLIARDGGKSTLSMVPRVHPVFISPANVQDGFFPGPIGPNTN
jgi:hypothetical protein